MQLEFWDNKSIAVNLKINLMLASTQTTDQSFMAKYVSRKINLAMLNGKIITSYRTLQISHGGGSLETHILFRLTGIIQFAISPN